MIWPWERYDWTKVSNWTQELDDFDRRKAKAIALARYEFAREAGLKDAHGLDPQKAWQANYDGTLAEVAAAKFFGFYYTGTIGSLDRDDVGPFQIRGTPYGNGHLILHRDPKDPPHKKYILATGGEPRFTLEGWCYGYEGKTYLWWDKQPDRSRPCFWIPSTVLHSMKEIGIK
jgi:hypothetical protein